MAIRRERNVPIDPRGKGKSGKATQIPMRNKSWGFFSLSETIFHLDNFFCGRTGKISEALNKQ